MIVEWMIQLPVLFFSVVVHEVAHGWAAFNRGDDTAERAGRLTLHPGSHIDPFGSVFLPLLCFFVRAPMFGWARPVPVNQKRLKDPRRDMVHIALMGPLSNILLALGAALLFKVASLVPGFTPAFRDTVLQVLFFAVTINLFLAFFNLIPVYPLDGSRVLGGLLPGRFQGVYRRHMPYGMIIILVLLFTRKLAALVLWPAQETISILTSIGILG